MILILGDRNPVFVEKMKGCINKQGEIEENKKSFNNRAHIQYPRTFGTFLELHLSQLPLNQPLSQPPHRSNLSPCHRAGETCLRTRATLYPPSLFSLLSVYRWKPNSARTSAVREKRQIDIHSNHPRTDKVPKSASALAEHK